MKKTILQFSSLLCLLTLIASCRKADNPSSTPTSSGKILLEFANNVGGETLKMDGTWYKNQNNDSFTVSKFNYYISNIKINKADGTSYSETESYHLLQHSLSSSMNITLSNVPAGVYNSISYTIGVDSLRNVSGAQTGALDPTNNMFWSWLSGYIMLKFEGLSPKSKSAGNELAFHIGGFSGTNSVLKTITINFPNAITVNGDVNHVHLNADVLKLFGTTNNIDFSTISSVTMPGMMAKKISDNYQNMFSISYAGK
jgi:hypothetical protein